MRQSIALMLGLPVDHIKVKRLSVMWQHSLPGFSVVADHGHGNVNVYIADHQYASHAVTTSHR